MASTKSGAPQWVVQLESPPAAKSKIPGIPDPPGFSSVPGGPKKPNKDSKVQPRKPQTPAQKDTLKVKKAWEVALGPVKALPMSVIMMYMSGNSLQIFSIMMVVMAFKNPIMGLIGTNQAFERFQSPTNGGDILQTKLVYVAMQVLALAVGVWKLNAMGLLPTTRSDWLMWEAQRQPLEQAVMAL